MALDGVKRVRVNTLEAVGDYIHAEDVARAIVVAAARAAPALQQPTTSPAVRPRASATGRLGGGEGAGFHAEIVPPEQADILQDPTLSDGMWGAYDISRIDRRDRLEAAPGARGAARLHGLDGRARRQARTGDAMTPHEPTRAT